MPCTHVLRILPQKPPSQLTPANMEGLAAMLHPLAAGRRATPPCCLYTCLRSSTLHPDPCNPAYDCPARQFLPLQYCVSPTSQLSPCIHNTVPIAGFPDEECCWGLCQHVRTGASSGDVVHVTIQCVVLRKQHMATFLEPPREWCRAAAMPCHASPLESGAELPCHAMPCHAMLCHTASRCAMPCHGVPRAMNIRSLVHMRAGITWR